MKTIVLEEPGRFSLADTPLPERLSGQALVRVHRIGICGTDLHAFRGRQPFLEYPRILGHELGVEVLEIGPNERGLLPGDRCAVEPYLNCGRCIACRRGKPNCCVRLRVLGVHTDGGMREIISIPIEKLHRSDALSFDELAVVEPLGIGHHAVGRARLDGDESVLVIGAGPIGLSVIQLARVEGARIIVMDVNATRLEFCRRAFGIEHVLDATGSPMNELIELTGGELPTAVFDATGNPQSMERSFDLVAHGGRIVLVGLAQSDIRFHDPDFHRRELTLLSTRNSTPEDFRRIIRLIEKGEVDAASWITHRATSDDVIGAFPRWLDPGSGTIKALVSFDE